MQCLLPDTAIVSPSLVSDAPSSPPPAAGSALCTWGLDSGLWRVRDRVELTSEASAGRGRDRSALPEPDAG
jgi:hypothetical protein